MTPRPYPETILVVDDTEFMVKMLDDIFGGAGYRVHAARSGEESLALYEEVLPDLVTLDVVMPGLDGIATLERLRRLDPACRVIMVSAVGQEERVLAALQRGARNYVLKPFEREKVLAVARRVLDEY